MASRQERRKAERDAAKRAPRAGAAGAAGAAATDATLNVNAGGNWKTQTEDPCVGPGGFCLACHFLKLGDVQRARDRGGEAEGCEG
jgi:hypothetical protein